MLNEQHGKMEINITHSLSNTEHIRRINHMNLFGDNSYCNTIVETRCESRKRRMA